MFNRREWQLAGVVIGMLLGVKGLYALSSVAWAAGIIGYGFALLLLGIPLVLRHYRLAGLDFLYPGGHVWARSLTLGLAASALILPLYLLGNHFYQQWCGATYHGGIAPKSWPLIVSSQLLLVAIPEEFFFRGFLQEECNRLWGYRWRIGGVHVGWGWIVVALIFALSHSVIELRWWHLFIFLPALLFGWLREATGGITAPVLFHTVSNCAAQWIAWHYR